MSTRRTYGSQRARRESALRVRVARASSLGTCCSPYPSNAAAADLGHAQFEASLAAGEVVADELAL